MRQTHKVGEKLFIDYSGDGVPIVDPQTGEIRRAQIFVAVPELAAALAAWSP